MEKPIFEVVKFGEDIAISTSDCPDVCSEQCGVHTCNAECGNFCKPECGTVYD